MESGICAQLFTLRDYLKTPADVAVTLRRVKQIGYPAVQLSGIGPIDPKELAVILQNEGLTAAATHVSFQRLIDDLPAVIDEHHLWGCKNVAVGAMPPEYINAEGYVRFAKQASEIARTLDQAGLTFSYHNHSFEFEHYNNRPALQILFEHSDPLVKAEIDTFWVQHGGGDPAEWIRKVSGRMVIVHFKDMVMADGQQVMAEVGEGNLNWPNIVRACREAGVQWYAVEQDICRRDPFDSLAISLHNMQQMGAGVGM